MKVFLNVLMLSIALQVNGIGVTATTENTLQESLDSENFIHDSLQNSIADVGADHYNNSVHQIDTEFTKISSHHSHRHHNKHCYNKCRGPAGQTGRQGPTGPTGYTGSTGLSGNSFNVFASYATSEEQTVNVSSNILFEILISANQITYSNGVFTVPNPGTYLITAQAPGPHLYALDVNGSYYYFPNSVITEGFTGVVLSIIVTIEANSTISINLVNSASGSQTVFDVTGLAYNAYLTINQIN